MAAPPIILVVSRDSDTLEVFGQWLGHLGYAVHALADPDEALALARALRPDLVITNFPTPLTSGTTLTALLRATPDLASTKVLSVSSHVMPEEIEAAIAAGVSATVRMPAPLQEVADQVQRLVGPGRR